MSCYGNCSSDEIKNGVGSHAQQRDKCWTKSAAAAASVFLQVLCF
jgi:hypothetical protein